MVTPSKAISSEKRQISPMMFILPISFRKHQIEPSTETCKSPHSIDYCNFLIKILWFTQSNVLIIIWFSLTRFSCSYLKLSKHVRDDQLLGHLVHQNGWKYFFTCVIKSKNVEDRHTRISIITKKIKEHLNTNEEQILRNIPHFDNLIKTCVDILGGLITSI